MQQVNPRIESLRSVQVLRRFQEFVRIAAASGGLLIFCTVIALIWANSPWSDRYVQLWETTFTIQLGGAGIAKDLIHWINDGLMAVFFLVVGLEIKREVLQGELASVRQAALPIAGALGGMLVPAALYALINVGTPGSNGWGVPMATDIAFALGVMAMLGSRVPLSLKIFLTALAIVDDIGAVLVIAIFYTAEISWGMLGLGLGLLALLAVANLLRVRSIWLYTLVGLVIWYAFLKSGVHATVAGVLLAFTIPHRAGIPADSFLARSRELLNEFDRADDHQPPEQPINEDQHSIIQQQETLLTLMQSPLQRIEHALHPFVSWLIMPIFALANAGIVLAGADVGGLLGETITLGIVVGLLVGKPIGIISFALGVVALKIAALPEDVTRRQLVGAGVLGGIGFTMSLFIAGLAFETPEQLLMAKVGILAASVCAGILGWGMLRIGSTAQREQTNRAQEEEALA